MFIMEIIFLGTSAAIPTKTRNLPSIAILLQSGKQILFDAGEDVQRRFEETLKFNQPLTIFISHMHGDHIIGLPGLLFHFGLIQRTRNIKIFGPQGIFAYLMVHKYTTGLGAPFLKDVFECDFKSNSLIKYDFQKTPDQIPERIPISNNIIYEDNEFSIKALPVQHSVPTMGFRLIEKPHPGKFDPKKATELNIPMGPLWKRMQEGKIVTLNGQKIDPLKEGIIGPPRPGTVIAYSGDTEKCKQLVELAKNSDVFICESTYMEDLKELAAEKKHMSIKQCAEVALEANAKSLILTHISARYSDLNEDIMLKDVKNIFPNITIAKDLLKINSKNDFYKENIS